MWILKVIRVTLRILSDNLPRNVTKTLKHNICVCIFIFPVWISHFLRTLAKNSHFQSHLVLETRLFEFPVQFCMRNTSQNMLSCIFIFHVWISHFLQKLPKTATFNHIQSLKLDCLNSPFNFAWETLLKTC